MSKIYVHVSKEQLRFYEDLMAQDRTTVLRRMAEEFRVGLTHATELYDGFPDTFRVVGKAEAPVVPSHSRDTRQPVFLPKEALQTLKTFIEGQVGEPYEGFLDLDYDLREDAIDHVTGKHPDLKVGPLERAVAQFPLGVYSMPLAEGASMAKIKELILNKEDAGIHLSQGAAGFLESTADWEESSQVTAYLAVAELLYDRAERMMIEANKKKGS